MSLFMGQTYLLELYKGTYILCTQPNVWNSMHYVFCHVETSNYVSAEWWGKQFKNIILVITLKKIGKQCINFGSNFSYYKIIEKLAKVLILYLPCKIDFMLDGVSNICARARLLVYTFINKYLRLQLVSSYRNIRNMMNSKKWNTNKWNNSSYKNKRNGKIRIYETWMVVICRNVVEWK